MIQEAHSRGKAWVEPYNEVLQDINQQVESQQRLAVDAIQRFRAVARGVFGNYNCDQAPVSAVLLSAIVMLDQDVVGSGNEAKCFICWQSVQLHPCYCLGFALWRLSYILSVLMLGREG